MSQYLLELTGELDMQSPAIGGSTTSGDRYYVDISQLTEEQMQVLKGEQGIQGIRGETGLRGPQGFQGPKGDKGEAFAYSDFTPEQLASLVGPQGSQGPKGDTGEQGPQGIQGEIGPEGPQGEGWDSESFSDLQSRIESIESGDALPTFGSLWGVGQVIIPEDAVEGIAKVSIRGLKLENYASTLFMDPSMEMIDIENTGMSNGIVSFSACAQNGGMKHPSSDELKTGHEYLGFARIQASSDKVELSFPLDNGDTFSQAHSGSGEWEIVAVRFIATMDSYTKICVLDTAESGWEILKIDSNYGYRIFDLTDTNLTELSNTEISRLMDDFFTGETMISGLGYINNVSRNMLLRLELPALRSNSEVFDEIVWKDNTYYHIQRIDDDGVTTLENPLEREITAEGTLWNRPGDLLTYTAAVSEIVLVDKYGNLNTKNGIVDVIKVCKYGETGEYVLPPESYTAGTTSITLSKSKLGEIYRVEYSAKRSINAVFAVEYPTNSRGSSYASRDSIAISSKKLNAVSQTLQVLHGNSWRGESLESIPTDALGLSPRNLVDVFNVQSVQEVASILNDKSSTGNFSGLRLGDYFDLPSLSIGADSINPEKFPAVEITNNPNYNNLRVELVAVNNYLNVGNNYDMTKPHMTFMFKNIPFKRPVMVDSSTEQISYSDTDLRHWINEQVGYALTTALGLARLRNLNRSVWGDPLLEETVFLPTLMNIFGHPGKNYGTGTTESQFTLYALNPNRKVKLLNGTPEEWWLSEPDGDSIRDYTCASNYGKEGYGWSTYEKGIVMAFVI